MPNAQVQIAKTFMNVLIAELASINQRLKDDPTPLNEEEVDRIEDSVESALEYAKYVRGTLVLEPV